MMHDCFRSALKQHRAALRQRWEMLLRGERVSSPLAHPDALVHLMDWTLDRLFDELRQPQFRRHASTTTTMTDGPSQGCPCGRNPLLTYFCTLQQALVETLFVADAALAPLSGLERSANLHEIRNALHAVARREIDSFCAVCQLRAAQDRTATSCRQT